MGVHIWEAGAGGCSYDVPFIFRAVITERRPGAAVSAHPRLNSVSVYECISTWPHGKWM